MSAASQSYLIEAAGSARLGLGGALFFLTYTAGSAAGNLCTGLVTPLFSFQQIGLVMTVAGAGVVLLAWVLLPAAARPAAAGPAPGLSLWSAYSPLLRRPEVLLIVGVRLGITSFWGMAWMLLPLLVYRASGSAATAAYYGAVSLAAASTCQIAVGALRDRFGRTWPLLISGAGIVVSACLLASSSESLRGLFVFGTALTVTAWAVSVLVPSLIDEVADASEKNRVVGLGHLAWSAAMAVGGLLGGALVEINSSLPFFVGALMAAAGTCCLFVLCRRLDHRIAPG